MPALADIAARRGIVLRALLDAPTAGVRLAECRDGATQAGALLARWRRDRWIGRTMLLIDGDGAAVAAGLDAGADDAVPLNAAPVEIAARLASLLRKADHPVLNVGGLRIDRLRRRVTRDGQAIAMLPREYELLVHLAERAGHTVSRAALLHAIWSLPADPGTNVVAVHISRLRARLHDGSARPILHTDRGAGYRLAAT